MTINYKFVKDFTGENVSVQRLTDKAYIPFDEANIDYQEYLEWVAEGNTAEAAD